MQRRKFLQTTAISFPAIALGHLAVAQPQRTNKGFVVKKTQSRFQETTRLFGNTSPNDIKVAAADTDAQLSIFEFTGNVKGGPPLHIHPHQDEIFFIVEGEYLFQVGEERHTLTQGDTIFLPRNVPHCFAQTSPTGKMFFLFQPAGKMESFFRKMAAFNAPPTPEEGAALFAAHDMKVVGPPITI